MPVKVFKNQKVLFTSEDNLSYKDKEIRVIGPDGEQLGIMSSSEALNMAVSKNLDLVKIAPKAVPPVCKIMNYGKYRFELAKRARIDALF